MTLEMTGQAGNRQERNVPDTVRRSVDDFVDCSLLIPGPGDYVLII